MSREITLPAVTFTEEIQSLEEFVVDKIIKVVVGRLDSNGNWVIPQQFSGYTIKGADYDELLSANPSWNPNKPEGTYFNDDLWHFIDLQRASKT